MNDTTTDPAALGADDAHDFGPSETFTSDQQRTMARWAIEDGSLTREEANAALQAEGLEPLTSPAAVDENSTAADALDAGFPPAEPGDYTLPPLVGEGEDYTADLQAFDQARREWLAAARLPKGIGESIAQAIQNGMTNYATLDENAREIQHRAELERVHRHFGEDTERMLGLARWLVTEIDTTRPGLVDYLDATGASNSAFVTIQLALQADRLYQRRGRNP